MNTCTKALLGPAVVATILAGSAGTAHAEYKNRYGQEVGPFSLAAQFDYGFWTGNGNVDAYGPGLGLRAGYTLDPGVYLGIDFDYFFGEENSVNVLGIANASAKWNVYDFMAEIGYDLWVYRTDVVRPKLGLGVGISKVGGCGNAVGLVSACTGDSTSGFSIAPGLQYMHYFDNVFISIEGRYQTVAVDGPDPSAIVFGLGVGVAL